MDKLSQNNLIKNFISKLFERFWQFSEHTDVAAQTPKWEMKLKCSFAIKLKFKVWT